MVPAERPAPKLSICITTFNRAALIGTTLESIIVQDTSDCEVLILDGGSTDNTKLVVSQYIRRSDRFRYVRQENNNGFDRDCDRAVELARGEYCWLMTDDDLLKTGAVATVLQVLSRDVSLIIVNAENKDFTLSNVLQRRRIEFDSDRVYGSGEMDRLFVEVGNYLQYVGCIVIKRSIWLARERQRYYDSWFIHVGVIFQEPLPGDMVVIAEPLISYRMGNAHTWSPHVTEILLAKWPSLLRTVALSESARGKISSAEPWRHPRRLLLLRALGFYSYTEYQRWVRPQLHSSGRKIVAVIAALIPGELVNAFFVFYYSTSRPAQGHRLQQLKESRFYFLRGFESSSPA